MKSPGELEVHQLDLLRHADDVAAIDTSFTSNRKYLQTGLSGLRLAEVETPVHKRFPLDLEDGSWGEGFVAIHNGRVSGVVAIDVEAWNRRLIIRHLYVDRPSRVRGIARELMQRALGAGKRKGAVVAWVESSNVNVPAIEAYGRLGFEICGFDATLYTGTAAPGEFAIFLARTIDPP